MKKLAVLAVLLAACSGSRPPQVALPEVPWRQAPDLPLDLRAWQSAEEVPLLAIWTVVVDLYCGPGVECDFTPTVPAGFRGAVAAAEFAPLGAGRTRRFVLDLQPVQLGELEVPPMRAEAKGGDAGTQPTVATTPLLKLRVTSVLSAHDAAIEAPAPPFAPRFDLTPWLLGALAVVLLVLGTLAWRRRPKRKRQAADETPLPPHTRALRALARLRSASRATAEEVDAFYVEVSRILRCYLEERFGLHAPERTTEEFLAELNAQGERSPLDGRQRNALAGFLGQCDLVKFARVLPGEEVHTESLRIAEEMVESTRPDRVLQEAGA